MNTNISGSNSALSEEPKKKPLLNNQDFYWRFADADDNIDGNLHIISTVDGSSLKIPLGAILDYVEGLKDKNYSFV